MLRNLGAKAVKGYSLTYSVYQNKLYSDEIVGQVGKPVVSETFVLDKDASRNVSTRFEIAGARLWSAEEPNRYTLVAELKDKKRQDHRYCIFLFWHLQGGDTRYGG